MLTGLTNLTPTTHRYIFYLLASHSFSQTAIHWVMEKEKKLDFSLIPCYNTTEAFLSHVLIISIWLVT